MTLSTCRVRRVSSVRAVPSGAGDSGICVVTVFRLAAILKFATFYADLRFTTRYYTAAGTTTVTRTRRRTI